MPETDDMVQALRPVIGLLDQLGVRYCVGGSVASAFHGARRGTFDVDLSAELDQPSALQLFSALKKDYYCSERAIRDAVRRHSCFNLIHLATSFKVDIFVSRARPFDRSVQDRAVQDILGDVDQVPARIATPEDIILLKLEWYQLGGGTSERQWSDVSIVAKLHKGTLDRAYLKHWALDLEVSELLNRLLADIGD